MIAVRNFFLWCSLIVLAVLLVGCNESAPITPKPRGYPRIDFPEKSAWQTFDTEECPFTFSHPGYTQIIRDSLFFGEPPENPCWFHVFYPSFDGRLYFSYHPIGQPKSLDQLKTDAFDMLDWHNKRANYIEEQRIQKGDVNGILFSIEGPAASPMQFYLTDEKAHFLKATFYFNTQARPDSLAPMTAFVREDIQQLLESFTWKDE